MSLYIKSEKTNQIAKKTRNYRNLHKWVAIPLLIFLFNTGVTGLLLGWKKEAQLLPELQKGITSQPKEWISLKEIDSISNLPKLTQTYSNLLKLTQTYSKVVSLS